VRKIPFPEFSANLFALLKSVQETRQPFLVTRFGTPVAEIHPAHIGAAEKERLRAERDARDLEILNRYAAELNSEAEGGLDEQDSGSNHKNKAARNTKSRRR
jgi:PHD/YefM family antitoxin component YafN of YafNO toxin-antitoxin module